MFQTCAIKFFECVSLPTWLLILSIKSVNVKICGREKGWTTGYLFICYKIFLNKFIFILGGMEYCLHVDPLQVFMLLCPSKENIKICQWARLLKEMELGLAMIWFHHVQRKYWSLFQVKLLTVFIIAMETRLFCVCVVCFGEK